MEPGKSAKPAPGQMEPGSASAGRSIWAAGWMRRGAHHAERATAPGIRAPTPPVDRQDAQEQNRGGSRGDHAREIEKKQLESR